jgi:UPF0042 nucleotide-binding protein
MTDLLVLTGMSGAGRSTVAHALEDLGWYVVDNLPPKMISQLYQVAAGSVTKIAVVIDVRGRAFFEDLTNSLSELKGSGIEVKLAFMDASDEVLIRRFESTRRPHPLQLGDGISDGIKREREQLQDLRALADLVVDSSSFNVHQLEARVQDLFAAEHEQTLNIQILSFGFKYGIPVDADLVMDVRFIPNPHWIPELRPLTGKDEAVRVAVIESPGVALFIEQYLALLETVITGFTHERRRHLTIAIGCTGGKHRSVAVVNEIASAITSWAAGKGEISVSTTHRDLGRELK